MCRADYGCIVQRESFDEELAALPLEEREAYLKEIEEADKVGEHKKGGLLDRCEFLILSQLWFKRSDTA
jgi:hypothetical protein